MNLRARGKDGQLGRRFPASAEDTGVGEDGIELLAFREEARLLERLGSFLQHGHEGMSDHVGTEQSQPELTWVD